jgi:hypothetical protein
MIQEQRLSDSGYGFMFPWAISTLKNGERYSFANYRKN